jgi:hypothetical protein
VRELECLGKISSASVLGCRVRRVKCTGEVRFSKKAHDYIKAGRDKVTMPTLDGQWVPVDCSVEPVLECSNGQNTCLSAADNLLPTLESTVPVAIGEYQSTGHWHANTGHHFAGAPFLMNFTNAPFSDTDYSFASVQPLYMPAPGAFVCAPLSLFDDLPDTTCKPE